MSGGSRVIYTVNSKESIAKTELLFTTKIVW